MSKRPDINEFRDLFLKDVPLMDVRSPIEFDKGAFPGAVNFPLMSDDERHQIGIMYKEHGQDAAIDLGNELVSGDAKAKRLKAWKAFAAKHPEGYLYCFRGGLRSRTVQAWMAEAGLEYPLVKGGYKALRRFLIEECDRIAAACDFIVVGGRTGTGKTLLIHELPSAIDLEGLANHRGSSFGRSIDDYQPSQINFENALAVALMKIEAAHKAPVFVEDESPRIGRLSIPLSLVQTMSICPMVLVEEPLEARIANIKHDYVTDLLAQYMSTQSDGGFEKFADFLLQSLSRIKKRLGGARYSEIHQLMQEALNRHRTRQDEGLHDRWIEKLLIDYYDPMYDYQLAKKEQPVIFTGRRSEIMQWHYG